MTTAKTIRFYSNGTPSPEGARTVWSKLAEEREFRGFSRADLHRAVESRSEAPSSRCVLIKAAHAELVAAGWPVS